MNDLTCRDIKIFSLRTLNARLFFFYINYLEIGGLFITYLSFHFCIVNHSLPPTFFNSNSSSLFIYPSLFSANSFIHKMREIHLWIFYSCLNNFPPAFMYCTHINWLLYILNSFYIFHLISYFLTLCFCSVLCEILSNLIFNTTEFLLFLNISFKSQELFLILLVPVNLIASNLLLIF